MWPFPPPPGRGRGLQAIKDQLNRIEHNTEVIMSGLQDLQAAVAQEGTDISTLKTTLETLIADVKAALANNSGDSDAAVEAVAQLVQQADAIVNQANTEAAAADPGAPAAPPVTPPAAS